MAHNDWLIGYMDHNDYDLHFAMIRKTQQDIGEVAISNVSALSYCGSKTYHNMHVMVEYICAKFT